MNNGMFKWNGTEVTDLLKNAIIEEGIYHKTIYWRITWDENLEDFCMVRTMSNGTLSCLIDEIKPIFNLQKIGTHWIKYNNKKLILLKVNLFEGSIIYDLTLDLFDFHPKLCSEVQKIFAFRDLLGISKSYEKSIVLREITKYNYISPVSFYEPNMEPSSSGKIPNTVLEKWFKDTSIDQVVKKMFKIEDAKELVSVLYNLRCQLEKVVERCDRNSIIFVDEIVSKVGAKLQNILEI